MPLYIPLRFQVPPRRLYLSVVSTVVPLSPNHLLHFLHWTSQACDVFNARPTGALHVLHIGPRQLRHPEQDGKTAKQTSQRQPMIHSLRALVLADKRRGTPHLSLHFDTPHMPTIHGWGPRTKAPSPDHFAAVGNQKTHMIGLWGCASSVPRSL